jgi:hypothetical protein
MHRVNNGFANLGSLSKIYRRVRVAQTVTQQSSQHAWFKRGDCIDSPMLKARVSIVCRGSNAWMTTNKASAVHKVCINVTNIKPSAQSANSLRLPTKSGQLLMALRACASSASKMATFHIHCGRSQFANKPKLSPSGISHHTRTFFFVTESTLLLEARHKMLER